VLHPDGGALKSMLAPFRLGIGGPMGTGRQYMSWIHLEDWVSLVGWLAAPQANLGDLENGGIAPDTINAVVSKASAQTQAAGDAPRFDLARQDPSVWNATAPVPVTNAEFGRTLGAVLNRPAMLPAPAFGLKLLLGEFANFLLTGARVIPAAAERAGFRFRYRELEPALRSLLQDQGDR
jgi:NAD dependent epimerase/dehydratase family enzyme